MRLELEDDELMAVLVGGVGLLVLWQLGRFRTVSPYTEGAFPGQAPAGGFLNELLPMTVSPAGRAFIKDNEKLRLQKYEDPPGSGQYSIGWGHHIQAGENIPNTINLAQAQDLFDSDVAHVEDVVNQAVKVALSQGQFDALADFVYNEGVGHFESSTLLSKLNAGDYQGAADEFSRWDIAAGQVNRALEERRQAEQGMFSSSPTPTA